MSMFTFFSYEREFLRELGIVEVNSFEGLHLLVKRWLEPDFLRLSLTDSLKDPI
jgi:hypothetical protein